METCVSITECLKLDLSTKKFLHQRARKITISQNIDMLERRAGVEGELLVEAHGTFHTAHCLDCGQEYPLEYVQGE